MIRYRAYGLAQARIISFPFGYAQSRAVFWWRDSNSSAWIYPKSAQAQAVSWGRDSTSGAWIYPYSAQAQAFIAGSRITQISTEVIILPDQPSARISQTSTEVIIQPTSSSARTTQISVEAIYNIMVRRPRWAQAQGQILVHGKQVYAQAQAWIKTTHPTLDTYPAAVKADGPFAYYRFEETSNTLPIHDEMGSYDGSYNGTTVQQASFSANNYSVYSPQVGVNLGSDGKFNTNDSFTIEYWVKGTGGGGWPGVMNKGGTGGNYFLIYGGRTYQNYKRNGGEYGGIPTTEGVWNYTVWTYDGSHFKGYWNGTLYLDNVVSLPDISNGSAVQLFRGDDGFAGYMDEIAFYDHALTQDQITAHYMLRDNIISTSLPVAQAKAWMVTSYRGYAQAQARIKQTYPFADGEGPFAQAQTWIRLRIQTFGQAQAYIKSHPWSFAQATVDIKQTYPTTSGYRLAVLSSNPIMYYPMDESSYGSGTIADIAGGNRNGTIYSSGATYGVASPVATGVTAITLGGRHIAVPDNAPATDHKIPLSNGSAITFEAWVNWDGTDGRMVFGFNTYDIYRAAGKLGFNTGIGNVYGVTSPASGTWFHLAAVMYSGQAMSIANKIYINGVLQTLSGTDGTGYFSQAFKIGGWNNDYSYMWGGGLDEVAIFDRELSGPEILQHYQSSPNLGTSTNPFGLAAGDTWARVNPNDPDNHYVSKYKNWSQAQAYIVSHPTAFAQAQALIYTNQGFIVSRNGWSTTIVEMGPQFPYVAAGSNVQPIWAVAKGIVPDSEVGTWSFRQTGVDDWTRISINGVDLWGDRGGSWSATRALSAGPITFVFYFASDVNWESLSVEYQRPASTGDTNWYYLSDGKPPWVSMGRVERFAQAQAYISPTWDQNKFAQANARISEWERYPSAVQADNPKYYYRLIETSGTRAADEFSIIGGTYSNSGILNKPGPLGPPNNDDTKSVQMTGGTGVNISSQPDISNNFTIEFWAKSDNVTTPAYPPNLSWNDGVDGNTRYILYPEQRGGSRGIGIALASNYIGVYTHGDGWLRCLASVTTTLGTSWHHYVVTVTNRLPKIYIDGLPASTNQVDGGSTIFNSRYWGWGPYGVNFSGYAAEISTYDYVLSDDRILAHYKAGSGVQQYAQAAAVAWWRDENSGAWILPVSAQSQAKIRSFNIQSYAQAQAVIQDPYGFTVLQNGVYRSEPGPQFPNMPNGVYWGFTAAAAAFTPDAAGAWTFTASADDSLNLYIDGVRILAGSGTAQANLQTNRTYTIYFIYGTDRIYPDYLSIQYQRPSDTTWYYLSEGKPPWIPRPTAAVFAQARARIAGKLSWWKFDEPNGTNFADSIDSNALTQQTGSVTLNGDSIYFSGNAYLQKTSPNVPLGNSPRSVSVWYKGTNTSDHTVFGYGTQSTRQAFALCINDTASGSNGWTGGPDTVGFWIWANDHSWSYPSINNGEWHLIVLTYNGDVTLEMFVDGSSLGSVNVDGQLNTVDGGSGIIVGRDFHQAAAYLEGYLNDLILWDRVVTSGEIAEMWGAGLLTKNAPAQAQAYIKGIVRGYSQAQPWIKSHPAVFAQAQVFIGWVRWAQAQAWIKSHPSGIGAARADVLQTYGGFAQAQVFIGWVRWAQAQGHIKAIGVTQQAQATLRVKAPVIAVAQAEAYLIRVAIGQSSTWIKQTYPLFSRDINWATVANGATVWASGENPGNAIDENPDTYWYVVEARFNPNGLPNSFIRINLNAVRTVNGFKVLPVLYDATAVLQYSTSESLAEDIPWVTVQDLTWSGITGSKDVANTQEYQIAPIAARHWRIQATSLDPDYYIMAIASFELGYYSVKSPTFAQAAALIGQWGFGLAQAYISPAMGWKFAQANADIIKVIQQYAQAQAFVIKACMIGYAQADILATAVIAGLANAWIIPPSMFAQAQATIAAYGIVQIGRATLRIKTWANSKTAMAKAMIHKFQGYSQAQAMVKMGRGHAFGLARMVLGHRQWAQAQAYIRPTTGSAQARAFMAKYRWVFGQSMALITRHINNAQAAAAIKQTYTITWGGAQAVMNMGWGLAQAAANIEVISWGFGTAKARIKQHYTASSQAQAHIRIKYLKAYAQARAAVRYRKISTGLALAYIGGLNFAQARAYIVAYGVPRFAQAQGYILANADYIPIVPTSDLHRYLVRFNGFDLPGYAQSESLDSILRITQNYAAYVDASMSEDIGLENSSFTLRMRLWEPTYTQLKEKVQLAATMLRSTRTFAPLYIQRYDRHYLAIAHTLRVEKTVGTLVTTLDYEVIFELLPVVILD